MASSLHPMMESNDAAEMNLGDDFINDVCLSNAEVAVILDKQKVNYVEQNKDFTSVFKKTQSYVTRFTGMKDPVSNQASVVQLRETLQSLSFEYDEEVHRLEEFEIACLTNLTPEEVEEAVALVPSLPKHFTDHEIEEILALVSRMTAVV
ncbi:RNA polymerase II [Phytophthora palmivora]|uniref:RNA polymerase II n=1 Tax=Phytophthora palmivora TaxID=4796 RepID=A0A2P4XSY3_9STRA|nr:RNA polymerase II [Phytophthora palmivora]